MADKNEHEMVLAHHQAVIPPEHGTDVVLAAPDNPDKSVSCSHVDVLKVVLLVLDALTYEIPSPDSLYLAFHQAQSKKGLIGVDKEKFEAIFAQVAKASLRNSCRNPMAMLFHS
jgi:hypothetical protein